MKNARPLSLVKFEFQGDNGFSYQLNTVGGEFTLLSADDGNDDPASPPPWLQASLSRHKKIPSSQRQICQMLTEQLPCRVCSH